MSFQDLGAIKDGSCSGGCLTPPASRRSPRRSRSYGEQAEPQRVPMKKNGSTYSTESTAATSSSAEEESPIKVGIRSGRGRGSFGKSNRNSPLSTSVDSLSGNVAKYQKLVADYEQFSETTNRGVAYGRKSRAIRLELDGLRDDIRKQVDVLGSAISERKGPVDSDELTCVKASYSKMQRDFQRIQSTHDALIQQTPLQFDSDNSGNFASGSGWTHDEPPLGSIHGAGGQNQMVLQREEAYSKQIMESRESDIEQINQKMNKVNEIYKDLGNIVGGQQDQIDAIEDTMADSNNKAAHGLEQLERANRPWFGGKKTEGHEEATGAHTAETTWGDSFYDGWQEFQNDMEAIGNDIAAKGRALQMLFCGVGGVIPDTTID